MHTTVTISRRAALARAGLYSALVLGVAFAAPLLGGSPKSPGPGFVLWAAAPICVSLLLRLLFRDWNDFGLRPRLGAGWKWYVVALAAIPAAMGLSAAAAVGLSLARIEAFRLLSYLGTAVQALPIFLVFAVFEELGWRGYLAPKLAALGLSPFLGYALTSVVWATWHLPFLRDLPWMYSAEPLATFLPRFYLSMFVYAILYGELRAVTGSVWPAVLAHAAANAFGHPLSEHVVTSGRLAFLGSASDGVITLAMVAAAGIGVYFLRRGREARGLRSS